LLGGIQADGTRLLVGFEAVDRVRRYLSSVSITPFGGIILFVFAVAIGVFFFGPSSAQAPALVVAALLLAAILGATPFGMRGFGLWRSGSLAARRSEFHPTDHSEDSYAPLTQQADEEIWRKERERYAQDDQRS
jgi:hypothetical protein